MEESIRESFELKKPVPLSVPVLSLAYLGDAVYELIVRTVQLERETGKNGALHKRALRYVSAVGQAKLINRYFELFREYGIPVG